jgi:hypothetical protein
MTTEFTLDPLTPGDHGDYTVKLHQPKPKGHPPQGIKSAKAPTNGNGGHHDGGLPPTGGNDQAKLLNELNTRYAVVTTGASVGIMTLQEDPPIFYAQNDFRLLLSHRSITVEGGQSVTKKIRLGTWWLAHPERRQYRGVVFEPGSPQEVRGCRNTWTGFSVEPKAGDCSFWLDFLLTITCAGNKEHFEYLLDVMADTVQHPNKQGEVAVVLRGEEGVGKGCTVKNFGMIFGRHYLPATQASQITGKFNGHLASCVVLFADEAFYAGDKQHEATLKALVTEGWIMIERKGLDAVRGNNLTHLGSAPTLNGLSPLGLQRDGSSAWMCPTPGVAIRSTSPRSTIAWPQGGGPLSSISS